MHGARRRRITTLAGALAACAALASPVTPAHAAAEGVPWCTGDIRESESGEPELLQVTCRHPRDAEVRAEVVGVAHGTAVLTEAYPQGDQTLLRYTYRSEPGYTGREEVVLRVRANGVASDPVRIVFTVTEAVDDPPTCFWSEYYGTLEAGDDWRMSFRCSDDEGQPVDEVVLDAGPVRGTLEPFERDGKAFTARYTATADGQETVVARGRVGGRWSAPATRTFTVAPAVDDPPTCVMHLDRGTWAEATDGRWEAEAGDYALIQASCADDERRPVDMQLAPLSLPAAFLPPQLVHASGATFLQAWMMSASTAQGEDDVVLDVADGPHEVALRTPIRIVPPKDDPTRCSGPSSDWPTAAGTPRQIGITCRDDESTVTDVSVIRPPVKGTVSAIRKADTRHEWVITYTGRRAERGTDSFTVAATTSNGRLGPEHEIEVTLAAPNPMSPEPAPAPEPGPLPLPSPDPEPEPEPATQPQPGPTPLPQPAPTPAPAPVAPAATGPSRQAPASAAPASLQVPAGTPLRRFLTRGLPLTVAGDAAAGPRRVTAELRVDARTARRLGLPARRTVLARATTRRAGAVSLRLKAGAATAQRLRRASLGRAGITAALHVTTPTSVRVTAVRLR